MELKKTATPRKMQKTATPRKMSKTATPIKKAATAASAVGKVKNANKKYERF